MPPPDAHRFTPESQTRHRLFACLALRASLKTNHRGRTALLAEGFDPHAIIGPRRTSTHFPLQEATMRLLSAEATLSPLEATIRRFLAGRRRVGSATTDASGFASR